MKEIDFQDIEDTIIQKHIDTLVNPDNQIALASTKLAARLAVLALKEYHQRLEENQRDAE